MEINIKLAESLIDAFDSEDTAIILWDKDWSASALTFFNKTQTY